MNKFLGGHKVLEVEQKFFQNEKGGYWTFCVRFIADAVVSVGGTSGSGKVKPDYKQLLPEAQFAIFSRLRELRKGIASEDGVPAYAVFTDEELANIARLPVLTEKSLKSIPGIGEKKVARYGRLMLERYHSGEGVESSSVVSASSPSADVLFSEKDLFDAAEKGGEG